MCQVVGCCSVVYTKNEGGGKKEFHDDVQKKISEESEGELESFVVDS